MPHHYRTAMPEDLPVLLAIAETFVAESALGYRFDPSRAEQAFWLHMVEPSADVLVIEGDSGLAGFAIVATDDHFTAEPVGYLVKFYIRPEARGSDAGRTLTAACVDWFDGRACVDAWATATAGIGQDGAFINLLGKFGFAPAGPTLRRLSPRHDWRVVGHG